MTEHVTNSGYAQVGRNLLDAGDIELGVKLMVKSHSNYNNSPKTAYEYTNDDLNKTLLELERLVQNYRKAIRYNNNLNPDISGEPFEWLKPETD